MSCTDAATKFHNGVSCVVRTGADIEACSSETFFFDGTNCATVDTTTYDGVQMCDSSRDPATTSFFNGTNCATVNTTISDGVQLCDATLDPTAIFFDGVNCAKVSDDLDAEIQLCDDSGGAVYFNGVDCVLFDTTANTQVCDDQTTDFFFDGFDCYERLTFGTGVEVCNIEKAPIEVNEHLYYDTAIRGCVSLDMLSATTATQCRNDEVAGVGTFYDGGSNGSTPACLVDESSGTVLNLRACNEGFHNGGDGVCIKTGDGVEPNEQKCSDDFHNGGDGVCIADSIEINRYCSQNPSGAYYYAGGKYNDTVPYNVCRENGSPGLTIRELDCNSGFYNDGTKCVEGNSGECVLGYETVDSGTSDNCTKCSDNFTPLTTGGPCESMLDITGTQCAASFYDMQEADERKCGVLPLFVLPGHLPCAPGNHDPGPTKCVATDEADNETKNCDAGYIYDSEHCVPLTNGFKCDPGSQDDGTGVACSKATNQPCIAPFENAAGVCVPVITADAATNPYAATCPVNMKLTADATGCVPLHQATALTPEGCALLNTKLATKTGDTKYAFASAGVTTDGCALMFASDTEDTEGLPDWAWVLIIGGSVLLLGMIAYLAYGRRDDIHARWGALRTDLSNRYDNFRRGSVADEDTGVDFLTELGSEASTKDLDIVPPSSSFPPPENVKGYDPNADMWHRRVHKTST